MIVKIPAREFEIEDAPNPKDWRSPVSDTKLLAAVKNCLAKLDEFVALASALGTEIFKMESSGAVTGSKKLTSAIAACFEHQRKQNMLAHPDANRAASILSSYEAAGSGLQASLYAVWDARAKLAESWDNFVAHFEEEKKRLLSIVENWSPYWDTAVEKEWQAILAREKKSNWWTARSPQFSQRPESLWVELPLGEGHNADSYSCTLSAAHGYRAGLLYFVKQLAIDLE